MVSLFFKVIKPSTKKPWSSKSIGEMGSILNALYKSHFERRQFFPKFLTNATTWSIFWYWTEQNYSWGMPSLIVIPMGKDKCWIILYSHGAFFGTRRKGLTSKLAKGGSLKGPATLPKSIWSCIFCFKMVIIQSWF